MVLQGIYNLSLVELGITWGGSGPRPDTGNHLGVHNLESSSITGHGQILRFAWGPILPFSHLRFPGSTVGNSEANLSACHGHKQGIIHAPFFPCAVTVTVFIYIYIIYIYFFSQIWMYIIHLALIVEDSTGPTDEATIPDKIWYWHYYLCLHLQGPGAELNRRNPNRHGAHWY